MNTIAKSNVDFLNQLRKNNNRDWFNANKEEYLKQYENTIAFADDLLFELKKHDNIETVSGKKSLFRIYRDVRFSKDKSPYKTHWAGGFKRATKQLRGGYYFHIEPGNSMVGGGFWAPNKEDLQRIREDIAADATNLRTIINSKSFKETFGSLAGEQLKTCPKGFDKSNSAVDLLRYQQFIVIKKFTDQEVLSSDFVYLLNDTFKKMRPFFDYMSESVTTDANGISIV
ncbi:MAG: TIGR02453 family protein [Bacteroidetes bacterium RIFCSPLOWO2_12_FULL_31_6]|nr:MAG: TIGR02453 family protein [Bacteroidetes bacterium RIFCSPLOWO2_12_FULL_31_6]